ncbi:hypothetical protein SKAU_G00394130 [Synaphobranchus kaupii]|uniref:Uncharacterized protein n=1 Tax=Synaphobranchus kaupii TaxID=118154 RepID=A0A9Q1EC43_SYNKA|nr:hypothetical protein SKAU_G00394130 [Synaphobranchus kaupii]
MGKRLVNRVRARCGNDGTAYVTADNMWADCGWVRAAAQFWGQPGRRRFAPVMAHVWPLSGNQIWALILCCMWVEGNWVVWARAVPDKIWHNVSVIKPLTLGGGRAVKMLQRLRVSERCSCSGLFNQIRRGRRAY